MPSLPVFRNGFGKKLIEQGIEELKKLNCNKMIIGCIKENVNGDEYEFSRPLGGKRISNDMSHLVSEERMDELFRTIVLGEDEER